MARKKREKSARKGPGGKKSAEAEDSDEGEELEALEEEAGSLAGNRAGGMPIPCLSG